MPTAGRRVCSTRCDGPLRAGPDPKKSGFAFRVVPVLLFLLVVALLAARVFGGDRASEALPADALGTWVTDGPDFENRHLELSAESVAFGQGGPEPSRHRIHSVEALPMEAGRAYRIHYLETDGSVGSLDILLAPDGTLRLPHPPEQVWRRR